MRKQKESADSFCTTDILMPASEGKYNLNLLFTGKQKMREE